MRTLTLCLLCLTPVSAWADDPVAVVVEQQQGVADVSLRRDPFREEVVKQIKELRKEGAISIRDAGRLRGAMYSPAFRDAAEDMAFAQMALTKPEKLPYTEAGMIDRGNFPWTEFTEFIKVFIPLLLELLIGLGI